jgi:hypothetical protein
LFVERVFIDDLPVVSSSRLRAMDIITAETTTFRVQLGDVEQDVSVHLRKFPRCGGSWSWFGCPACGRWVRVLRLLDGDVMCWRCCVKRGARYRCWPMSVRQRAQARIPKLRRMLQSEEPLRVKRSLLWSKVERRVRLEAALRKAELLVGYSDFVKLEPGEKDESDGSTGESSF